MACITLLAPLAMATTALVRAAHNEIAGARQFENNVGRRTLSMSWVVVTDSAGKRKLQARWTLARDRS